MGRLLSKRLTLTAAAIAVVAATASLGTGFTFGLFSATESSGANTFTAGTVTVAGQGSTVTCNVPAMMPGDSSGGAPTGNNSIRACGYSVSYTGTAPAWLAVDVQISNGGTALYDGSPAGLQLYLTDSNSTSYTDGTTYQAEDGKAAPLPTGTTPNLLVNTQPAQAGTDDTFLLNFALPPGAGNSYQGGNTTVTLTFHAVQAASNALPTPCSAGQQCNPGPGPTGPFNWS